VSAAFVVRYLALAAAGGGRRGAAVQAHAAVLAAVTLGCWLLSLLG